MKKSIKILSFILIFILLLGSSSLMSCTKQMSDYTTYEPETSMNYVINAEIKDGCLWVTYSNDPGNPVNIGSISAETTPTVEDNSGLSFKLVSNGTYGVSAGDAKYLEEIVIPDTHNGKPVTSILDNAFEGASNLKKITIPNTITNVGNDAFKDCDKLSFNEYDNALYLGNAENPNLILVKAKSGTITRCNVHEKTAVICDKAFNACSDLSTIALSSGIKYIGDAAFKGCSALTEVSLPSGLPYINAETFSGCSKLNKIQIPAAVTTIGLSAFSNCSSLAELTFAKDSTLTTIENSAFYGCKKLKEITFPKSLREIGNTKAGISKDGAFSGCSALEKVSFEAGSTLTLIGSYAFNSCTKLATIALPDSLTQIGTSAFNSAGLTEVKIPASVTTISDKAFFNCGELKAATLNEGLTKIGPGAFGACATLNNVTIPASVQTISKGAFNSGCTALTSVTFKKPAGWYDFAKAEPIPEASLKDAATAAAIIKNEAYTGGFSQ